MRAPIYALLERGWTLIAACSLVVVYYSVHGAVMVFTLLPLTASMLIFHSNITESLDKVLGGSALPDTVTKQFRIRSFIRTMVNKMGDVNLSDLFRAVVTVVLMLVNVLTVRGATREEVLLRTALILLWTVKLPSGESLHRVVAVLQRRACMKDAKPSAGAADSLRSLVQLLGCFVRIPFTPEEADPVPGTLIQQSMDSASRDSAAAGLSSASTITSDESLRGLKLASVSAAAASPTAASLSAANTAKQTEPSQPVQGSQRSAPTLRAVFIAAAVEACTLALCVAAPLLSALLEEHGLGAVAEHAEAATFRRRLYLPAQCAVLVLGALVQVAALALAAGYLLHRGTIALEVRNVLAAGNAVGAASKPALLSGMQRAVLQRVCAVFDCGARTVCNAHVGAVCRSDADEFACGVPNPGTGAMQTPAGGGKAVTGRGKAAAGRNAALATQPPLPQRLQCYVLNLALLSVLGVAGGLLALVLARWTGRRVTEGFVAASVVSAAVAMALRAAAPGACGAQQQEGGALGARS